MKTIFALSFAAVLAAGQLLAGTPPSTSSLLHPLDASLTQGRSHRLVVRVLLNDREVHHESYIFTLPAANGRAALPLVLQGATRETIEAMERDHPLAMHVSFAVDDQAAEDMTFARVLQQDAVARARALPVVEEYLLEGRRGSAAPKAAPPVPRVAPLTETMCPNSGYCMDDYWECKGGHGDNEGNEHCDFELYHCQFGEHYTRNVRTNNNYNFAYAIQVCAHDGFWEAFNPHIYLMGSHSYTDQVWDDWYCGGSLVSSTLVSSTNGSETCYSRTSATCEVGSAESIGGECTYP